jgi:predicted ATP-dependent protease
MIFKKPTSGTVPSAGATTKAAARADGLPAPRHPAVPPAGLRRIVDATKLGFMTTAELEPASGLIGQERALRAIDLGASIKQRDFNIFVLGPPAAGKRTAVYDYLEAKAKMEPAPPDWVYVNNYDTPAKPRAMALPKGRARRLEKAVSGAIDEMRTLLPALFESDEAQARRRVIDEAFRSTQEQALEALSQKAQAQDLALLRTPTGFALAPVDQGKVLSPEIFNTLSETARKEIETKINTLQKELQAILERVPKLERERRNNMRTFTEEVAEVAARQALEDVRAEFADLPGVLAHVDVTHADLVRHVGVFLEASSEEADAVKQTLDSARDARFRRWMVNVVVENGSPEAGAPIHEELNPTHVNLVGRIEHIAQMGTLLTDFLLIRPGALHKTNGGYLLIDARKLLLQPFAWEALKRALKSNEIRIEPPAEMAGFMATQSLEPDPIPLSLKVILFGDRELYYLLAAHDPDFGRLFKIQADFDESIEGSADNDRAYARLIASIVKEHGLRPVDAGGVARMIEEGARLADDNKKLSIEIGRLADVVREADYWAGAANRAVISRADIARAIDEHVQRSDRLREKAEESVDRGIVMIETDGARVGQINGLSVLSLGNFAFGRPSRITARVRMGAGRVVDIEREVKLGGPLHSKGVMILWGFLAGRYAHDVPLALAASLGFEQSYGGVDGDSASSAELYALLSALADVPIKQSLAVTGSVSQLGAVQAIGGVNEKIEGFFDTCKKRGLTGEQGVLIPQSNVQHLMLREDVVEAAKAGKFQIYPVASIDQGIEILTGIAAGERGKDGQFPHGTINRLVEQRLESFAKRRKAFDASDRPGNNGSSESPSS